MGGIRTTEARKVGRDVDPLHSKMERGTAFPRSSRPLPMIFVGVVNRSQLFVGAECGPPRDQFHVPSDSGHSGPRRRVHCAVRSIMPQRFGPCSACPRGPCSAFPRGTLLGISTGPQRLLKHQQATPGGQTGRSASRWWIGECSQRQVGHAQCYVPWLRRVAGVTVSALFPSRFLVGFTATRAPEGAKWGVL